MKQLREIFGMRRFVNKGSLLNELNSGVDECGLIVVEGTKQDFDRILFVNRETSRKTKFLKEELINSRVAKLQPDIVARYHHLAVQRFSEDGVTRVVNVAME